MATNTLTAHREGKVARTIEHNTAKLPSDIFLWAGLGLLGVAGALQFVSDSKINKIGLYIGQWAAPILITGLYNKVVKLEGHEGATSV